MKSPLLPVRGFPADIAQSYRDSGIWTGETFIDFLTERCERYAERRAVVGQFADGQPATWTYAELGAQAATVSARLHAAGVRAGDRVIVALPNIVEYTATIFGIFRLGALPVFGLPTHRELELTQFAELSDAAALVVATEAGGPEWAEIHRAVAAGVTKTPPVLIDVAEWAVSDHVQAVDPGAVAANEIAFLQLSGGTTGVSKLIPRTHDGYLYSVRRSVELCAVTAETVMLVSLPAAHNFAMSSPGILGVLHAGGAVVLARDPSPGTAFKLITAHGVTMASLVPPLLQAWISSAKRRNPDVSTLEVIQVGGAKLADTVAADVAPVLGATLQQVFGMAEGLVNYTRLDDTDELITTTQGRPMSQYDDVLVVDEDDRPVGPGAEGRLLTRGPYTIRGYYGAPHADADSFTADGFYRTGDLVRQLPTGHLIVTGRDKDQINRAGEKIATDELEGLALMHPAVLDAVAIGMPDPYLGERITLVIQLEQGHELPDLRTHLAERGLATFKNPDDVVVLEEFPATHVGKNSRRELRRILATSLNAGATS